MIGTVAVTDSGWYEVLSRRALPEVNFWTPSDRRRFSAPAFSPFFFKLKAPYRAIAGFGYFARWSSLPPWLAWECFDEGNGCESLEALEARLATIRARIGYVSITGEHSLPALEAAHIRSYARQGPHEVTNGILLRADLHRLFDKGYVTVTPDYRLEVSSRLKADYSNGRSYYPLNGQSLRLPAATKDRPASEFLTWHNENIHLG